MIAESPADGSVTARPGLLKRLLPLVLIGGGIATVFALDLHQYLSFQALAENREALRAFVAANEVGAVLGFAALYALAVALSIPGAVILTLAGGFLFGLWLGTAAVVVGATVGATAIFLAARTALGDLLRAKAGPWLARLEAGFRDSAFSYLLFLRLVPVFPFWLVNLVPAFLGVPAGTYVVATLLGILPGTFVYVSVGNGLGAVFDAGGTPDLGIIFSPEILLPIAGLAVLALIPVAVKKARSRRG